MLDTDRQANYPIVPLILHRHSPRAFTGDSISDQELMTMFEAARWAPSSYNSQPWRFVYAKRGTKQWQAFYDNLSDFNKAWTKHASALVFVVAKLTYDFNHQPSPTGIYDTGAAWENLALQAYSMGWIAHGMSGFDFEQAAEIINIPPDHKILAMIAIGKLSDTADLPEEMLAGETPNDRRPLAEIALAGTFK